MQVARAKKEAEQATVLCLMREMDDELRHWLLGQTLKRIRTFCDKYDCDGDGLIMSREVERDFVKDRDHEFLIHIAVRDLKVVGHLLARATPYYGRLYVYILQMEIDEGASLTLAQERAVFEQVIAWRRDLRADGIRAMAPSPVHVRRLRMLYGFSPFLTAMKWEDHNG